MQIKLMWKGVGDRSLRRRILRFNRMPGAYKRDAMNNRNVMLKLDLHGLRWVHGMRVFHHVFGRERDPLLDELGIPFKPVEPFFMVTGSVPVHGVQNCSMC